MIWLWVALMVALDGLAGLAGAALPERWLTRDRSALLGFAVGALLASALGQLIPEAVARGGAVALTWSALAIAVLAVAARWLARAGAQAMPMALLLGDALHNIGDGVAIAGGFLVSPGVGLVSSLAVIVHEVPEEVADYALLRAAGLSRPRAVLALAAVQLTAMIGAAATLAASTWIAAAEPVLLALAAGTFVHVAALDLLPDLIRGRQPAALLSGIAGAVIVLAIG